MVAVVRADDDVVVAGVFEHVVQVVVGLAGHEDAVVLEEAARQLDAALLPEALGEVVEHVGDPLRADLDETDAQPREPLRNTVPDDRMERSDHGELELVEAGLVEEEVVLGEAAGGRVHAQWYVGVAQGLVERREVGVAQAPVADQAGDVDAAGAVLQHEVQLLQGLVHGAQRQDRGPPEPVLPGLPDVAQPAVVALEQRHLHLRLVGDRAQEDGGIEHLHEYAHLVHVPQPRGDVRHLAGFLGSVMADVVGLGVKPAVHEPELAGVAGVVAGRDDLGAVCLFRAFHVGPGLVGLQHVRVCVDDRHDMTSSQMSVRKSGPSNLDD